MTHFFFGSRFESRNRTHPGERVRGRRRLQTLTNETHGANCLHDDGGAFHNLPSSLRNLLLALLFAASSQPEQHRRWCMTQPPSPSSSPSSRAAAKRSSWWSWGVVGKRTLRQPKPPKRNSKNNPEEPLLRARLLPDDMARRKQRQPEEGDAVAVDVHDDDVASSDPPSSRELLGGRPAASAADLPASDDVLMSSERLSSGQASGDALSASATMTIVEPDSPLRRAFKGVTRLMGDMREVKQDRFALLRQRRKHESARQVASNIAETHRSATYEESVRDWVYPARAAFGRTRALNPDELFNMLTKESTFSVRSIDSLLQRDSVDLRNPKEEEGRWIDRGKGYYEREREKKNLACLVSTGRHAGKSLVQIAGIRHMWWHKFRYDPFSSIISLRFYTLIWYSCVTYVLLWFLFAVLWQAAIFIDRQIEGQCLENMHNFFDALIMSVSTANTIGYGVRAIQAPTSGRCSYAIFVLSFQVRPRARLRGVERVATPPVTRKRMHVQANAIPPAPLPPSNQACAARTYGTCGTCLSLSHSSFPSPWLATPPTQHAHTHTHPHTLIDEWMDGWSLSRLLILSFPFLQRLVMIILDALVIGVLFSKLSQPKKRSRTIFISDSAVVGHREGTLKFMFRIGDARQTPVLRPNVTAYLYTFNPSRQRRTAEGEFLVREKEREREGERERDPTQPTHAPARTRMHPSLSAASSVRFSLSSFTPCLPSCLLTPAFASPFLHSFPLPLFFSQPNRIYNMKLEMLDESLLLPQIVTHVIDESSPLFGLTRKEMETLRAEIVVTFVAVNSETGTEFSARQSYLPPEIFFGYQFAKIIRSLTRDGRKYHAIGKPSHTHTRKHTHAHTHTCTHTHTHAHAHAHSS